MKTGTLLLLLLISIQPARASHLAGGYIQAKAGTGTTLMYEITVVLYMNEGPGNTATNQANSVSICFGDGTVGTITRASRVYVTNQEYSLNTFRTTHTYAGPGTYTMTSSLAGRTTAVNIVNSNSQQFTLTTTFTTNTGPLNQTPTPGFPLTGLRISVNQPVMFALNATDSDGDSLVYGLARPLTSLASDMCSHQFITSYQFPNDLTRKGTFKLNNRTGVLAWAAPVQEGIYSVVLTIYEYRNGNLISQTTQEINLLVEDKPGTPSIIPAYEPALEGSIVTAIATDKDTDFLFTAFPSPVDDQLQIVIQTSNPTTATVQLLDINGRKLHELVFNRVARQHEQVIGMDSLTPGVYLIRADIGGRSLLRKVVKR